MRHRRQQPNTETGPYHRFKRKIPPETQVRSQEEENTGNNPPQGTLRVVNYNFLVILVGRIKPEQHDGAGQRHGGYETG